MGRREHKINGMISINHVHDAPCSSRAFVPLASCCPLSSFLLCLVLKIGCSGVLFVFLRIVVDVAHPDGPLACHISSLVVVRFVGHHHQLPTALPGNTSFLSVYVSSLSIRPRACPVSVSSILLISSKICPF
jgi:hypothetical protein